MLAAIGFGKPAGWQRRLVEGLMQLRARLLRLLPARRNPFFFTGKKYRTYPDGYEIEELGAF